jgi:hypothetical protein
MLKHEFVWDQRLDYLRIEFEPPFELLGRYFDADVQCVGMAQDMLDLFQPVLDGRTPHFSGNGNSWWIELGPETTRLGHLFAEPPLEIEVPTKDFVELHAIYRDRKREHVRWRKEQETKERR